MKDIRAVRGVMLMAVLIVSAPAEILAQECGTLLYQTATVKKDASVPVFRFKVASGRAAFWSADIFIEIGHEGNAVTPPADPMLPAGVVFRVKRIDVPAEVTFPITGGSSTTIPDKIVSVTRGLEPAPNPQGLFVIQVVANTGTSVVEQWEVRVENLTGSWRIIGSVRGGSFNGVTPAPAECTGSTCPAGEWCHGSCPITSWCRRYEFYEYLEVVWPRKLPPTGCPRCSPLWKSEFDRSRFDRVFTTWMPTNAQRMALDSARDKSVRFNVTGGEVIGDVLEGNSGEFSALVQYPKGQPPLVTVAAGGKTIGQFRAQPPARAGTAFTFMDLVYGIAGLILGALGGLAVRLRGRRGPGDTQRPAPGTSRV